MNVCQVKRFDNHLLLNWPNTQTNIFPFPDSLDGSRWDLIRKCINAIHSEVFAPYEDQLYVEGSRAQRLPSGRMVIGQKDGGQTWSYAFCTGRHTTNSFTVHGPCDQFDNKETDYDNKMFS